MAKKKFEYNGSYFLFDNVSGDTQFFKSTKEMVEKANWDDIGYDDNAIVGIGKLKQVKNSSEIDWSGSPTDAYCLLDNDQIVDASECDEVPDSRVKKWFKGIRLLTERPDKVKEAVIRKMRMKKI